MATEEQKAREVAEALHPKPRFDELMVTKGFLERAVVKYLEYLGIEASFEVLERKGGTVDVVIHATCPDEEVRMEMEEAFKQHLPVGILAQSFWMGGRP